MQVYPAKPKEACSTVAVWLILNTTHLQAQHSIRTNPTEGATCLGHLPLLCPVVLLQEAFNARQIVPSNNVRYHAEGLKQALNDAYGVMPHITCDAQGELAEVRQRSLLCTGGRPVRVLMHLCPFDLLGL
eukprot:GHRQ01020395.1.p3 GENE.GHRQ01020395.1~~GHRQ01020395.1.p3  ORF type:complete len:130 (-),score=24.06 GHRQ01020395.1:262-651(-)